MEDSEVGYFENMPHTDYVASPGLEADSSSKPVDSRGESHSHTTQHTLNRTSTTSFGTFPDSDVVSEKMETVVDSNLLPILTTDNDPYLRAKSLSPRSDIPLVMMPERPDISIFCPDCARYIDLRVLNEHRTYHRSLVLMKYKGKQRPDSVVALVKRRKAIIRKLKKDASQDRPMLPTEVQKINDAYEFLKSDIEDTYEVYRRIIEKSPTESQGIALNCSPSCVQAIGICSNGNERWKSCMEDTRVFQDYFGNDQHKAFFAIYDGHHGSFAAEIAANELHHAVLSEMSKFDPRTKCTCTYNMADNYDISDYEIHSRPQSGRSLSERGHLHEQSTNVIHQIIRTCEEKMEEIEMSLEQAEGSKTKKTKSSRSAKDPMAEKMADAFSKAHKYTDILLSWGKDERSKVRWSGCSTMTCVVQDTPLGSLLEDKENEDTSPTKELKKGPPVLKQLGTLHLANTGNVRAVLVRGNRAYTVSRDHTPENPKEKNRVIKQGGVFNESDREMRVNGVLATTRGLGNHGDVNLKKFVTNEPYTTAVPIDQYAQLLILASNGIWEVFSEDDAAELALQILPHHQIPAPSSVNTSVLQLLDPPITPTLENPSEMSTHRTDMESMTEAADLARKMNKPRASTAQSRKSVTIAEHDEFIDGSNDGLRNNEQTLSKESVLSSVIINEDEDGLVASRNSLNTKLSSNQQPPSSSPDKTLTSQKASVKHGNNKATEKRRNLDLPADLRTEVGSNIDGYSEDEDDSGNEGDVDTEGISLIQDTSLLAGGVGAGGGAAPTKAEIQREYAKRMAERLCQAALLAGAKDNITVMVVLFPGCGV